MIVVTFFVCSRHEWDGDGFRGFVHGVGCTGVQMVDPATEEADLPRYQKKDGDTDETDGN